MGSLALDDLASVMELVRVTGPRFFGYVLGSGEPISGAADMLASVLNQNVTAWRSSPSAVTIERVVVGWLAEAIGCTGFTGSLTGGGSSANLMGLAMAREARVPANEQRCAARNRVCLRTGPHVDSQSHRFAGHRTRASAAHSVRRQLSHSRRSFARQYGTRRP